MTNVIPTRKVYDACIVGSGAAGGLAAKILTEGGMDVTLLEAGPMLDPTRDFKQHIWPYELPHRGAGTGGIGDEMMAPYSSWNLPGEPYSRAEGTRFHWFRTRAVGGRTNHWGQAAMRFSTDDLKPRSKSGEGEDWPLSYAELETYYEKVERCIGVFGPKNGVQNSGSLHLPAPKPRCTELLIQRACKRLSIPCEPATMAILTRPWNGRSACHYCGQCYRGCTAASCFSSSQIFVPPALATNRLRLLTNTMVREIRVGSDGKADSVCYVDKISRSVEQVRARIVVLAASACESARILMNSKSALFPDGLANSSGVVGKYLMDSVGSAGEGYFPELAQVPPHNHDGTGGMHLYIPRSQATESQDFPGGYHIEFGGGPRMPSLAEFHGVCENFESYGIALKKECQRYYGKSISFLCLGQSIPSEHNCCEIDHTNLDDWGIPTLRFHFKRSLNEIRMAKHMQTTLRSIVNAGGGRYLTQTCSSGDWAHGITAGGETYHELGTVRMGKDRRTSVLNSFCQAHDVKNLFVMDGACFVSLPDKTPTLTILALSWRASDYLLEQAKQGNI